MWAEYRLDLHRQVCEHRITAQVPVKECTLLLVTGPSIGFHMNGILSPDELLNRLLCLDQ